MQTNLDRLTKLNEEFRQFFAGYVKWIETMGVSRDACKVHGNWQNEHVDIAVDLLIELNELTTQAVEDLKLSEAMIHDLKEDKGLTQQVFRRDYTTQDVIAILEVAEEPMSFQDIIQALLRGGIYPENTFIINDAFRELNKRRVLSEEIPIDSWRHGKVMVGSPAWKKLPKSQQKLAKW